MERANISDSSRANASSNENGAGSPHLQTLGALLRERREATGISLAEVEKSTRIRQKYLVALEADEWHLLPGEVVGRGFLRNYANFLNLDANVIMDRRRTTTEATLNRSLADTSAGASLPPVREVDYRPKDVDLEHTPVSSRINEYLEAGQVWFAPIAATVAIILLIVVMGWGIYQIGDQLLDAARGLPGRMVALVQQDEPSDPVPPAAGVVDGTTDGGGSENLGVGGGNEEGAAPRGAVVVLSTDTPTPVPPTPVPPTDTPVIPTATPTETPIPLPTEPPTPVPLPPTNTPVPLPPTDTPVPVPTDTPVPQIVAPSCPDGRSRITTPGVNQTVSGRVQVTGSATHEQFSYYKLEFAPGAGAQGGYTYFDGAEAQVGDGVLGTFASSSLPNGAYTIQLTVVDQTGNYPPQCRVTITVQN